jgi:hypothetical protein
MFFFIVDTFIRANVTQDYPISHTDINSNSSNLNDFDNTTEITQVNMSQEKKELVSPTITLNKSHL